MVINSTLWALWQGSELGAETRAEEVPAGVEAVRVLLAIILLSLSFFFHKSGFSPQGFFYVLQVFF